MTRCAVAIFVKTPGLSPVKTRLAATAGNDVACEFYRRAVNIVEAVAAKAAIECGDLTPYWAVAEREALADPRWQSFAVVWQGEGGLGSRLARVYAELREVHEVVLMIGADSPLITPRDLRQARDAITVAGKPFVLGRALDGGFYLFGGRVPISTETWKAVTYSAADTANQLLRQLRPLGAVAPLDVLPDVDAADDLAGLLVAGVEEKDLLPSQQALLEWIRTMPSAGPGGVSQADGSA